MTLYHEAGKTKRWILDAVMFLLGSFIFAVSVNTFTSPNNIIPAGLTGIATMINYLFGAPIGITAILLNLPLFIWGIIEVGYQFIAKTIVATILSSIMIDLTAPFLPRYTGDTLLACIFGGLLLGIGLAFIFMRGGTTGGTDLIASLLSKHFRFLSLGKLILIEDLLIVVASAFVYRSFESPLYAILIIYISTKLIDSMLYGTDIGTGKMMFIVSPQNKEIAKKIMEDIGRGVTALKSRGGYSDVEGEVLLCAVGRQQVYKTYDLIRSIDPKAFIIVGDAGEIMGEGFREEKIKK